jgi:hypothetical protein
MKCEIVNPSDGCSISGDNQEALALACILLGSGQYALSGENGEKVCPLMLFGGGPEWYEKSFGRSIDAGLEAIEQEVAAVLETFKYHDGRSSMNNIGKRAKEIAKKLRAKSKAPLPTAPGISFNWRKTLGGALND